MNPSVSTVLFALLQYELLGTPLPNDARDAITPELLPQLYALSKSHDMSHLVADALEKSGLLPADGENIAQKTEDIVGPYDLHDFFLWGLLVRGWGPTDIYAAAQRTFDGRFDSAHILYWLRTFFRRFFNQQFKRSCLPDGPKVGSISMSPRGDWRMPSDASSASWLAECEEL